MMTFKLIPEKSLIKASPQFPSIPETGPKIYWRLESYVTLLEDGAEVSFYFTSHPIIRETPTGVIVKNSRGVETFICHAWRKKYAYPTPKEAINAFHYRLRSRTQFAKDEMQRVEALAKGLSEWKL